MHTSDTSSLSLLLRCGLSPNPSNQFRVSTSLVLLSLRQKYWMDPHTFMQLWRSRLPLQDSILDLVCKRANQPIFECLMKHGSELQGMSTGFTRWSIYSPWMSHLSRSFSISSVRWFWKDPLAPRVLGKQVLCTHCGTNFANGSHSTIHRR